MKNIDIVEKKHRYSGKKIWRQWEKKWKKLVKTIQLKKYRGQKKLTLKKKIEMNKRIDSKKNSGKKYR